MPLSWHERGAWHQNNIPQWIFLLFRCTPSSSTIRMGGCQAAGVARLRWGSKVERTGQLVGRAGSAKHPCVHEISVSTSDSCRSVGTVKQIALAGGSGDTEPLSFLKRRLGKFSRHRFPGASLRARREPQREVS